MPLTLGIRWQGRTVSISLPHGSRALELEAAIAKECGVDRCLQQLRSGFPPRPLDLAASPLSTLESLGIKDRESITLVEGPYRDLPPPPVVAEPALQAAAPSPTSPPAAAPAPVTVPAPAPVVQQQPVRHYATVPAEAVEEVERLVIPADNSCLFAAIISALGLQRELKPVDLREAVKRKILSDPSALDAECQADSGRGSLQYAEWIVKPDSWGGFVDMHILSQHLNVQICAICIRTLRVESFPNESPWQARVFLLYDGIHYDTIMAVTQAGKAGIFNVKDEFSLNRAVVVAAELQEAKQFTDTANFTLQCQHCFALLKGEADAQKHAKETKHFNFQEAPRP